MTCLQQQVSFCPLPSARPPRGLLCSVLTAPGQSSGWFTSLQACHSLQSHVWPIEHICVLINCPSGPPPLPQHPGIWGLGPCFSETHKEAHSAGQETGFGRRWATQHASHPRALSGLSAGTPGPASCPNISPSASPLSCGLLASPGTGPAGLPAAGRERGSQVQGGWPGLPSGPRPLQQPPTHPRCLQNNRTRSCPNCRRSSMKPGFV